MDFYKVLVIDDEAIIADSLAFMLENQSVLKLEVSAVYSADSALELLNAEKFDIVLSDIQMPGMSGLELLKEIYLKWPHCQVVLLTCHDNFDYAMTAMQYNVVRYVLKNQGDDAVIDALSECVHRLELKENDENYVSQYKEIAEAYNFALNEKLCSYLIGCNSINKLAVENILYAMNSSISVDKPINIMLTHSYGDIKTRQLYLIQLIFRSMIGYAINLELLPLSDTQILWLMQPTQSSNFTHAHAALVGLAEGIQDACFKELGLKITTIYASDQLDWDAISEHALGLIKYSGYLQNDDSEIALINPQYYDLELDKVDNQKYKKNDKVNSPAFVDYVLEYIDDHYSENVTLTSLSEHVYLNPSYLSRKFKEVTGLNISEVVTGTRMREACRLLTETNQRITIIATEVGYMTPAHFSRIFKTYNGCTPQDYRNNHTTSSTGISILGETTGIDNVTIVPLSDLA